MHPFLKERVRPKNFIREVWLTLYFLLFFLSFSFSAAFSFHLKRKSGKNKSYSPLNLLSSASAIRLRALVGARVPALTWASTDSRAAETASSRRNRFMR